MGTARGLAAGALVALALAGCGGARTTTTTVHVSLHCPRGDVHFDVRIAPNSSGNGVVGAVEVGGAMKAPEHAVARYSYKDGAVDATCVG